MEITLSKPELFAAAARFMSNEETRFYLCGIRIEPAPLGVYLVATDGHRMFVGHDPDASLDRAAIVAPAKSKLPVAWFHKGDHLTLADNVATLSREGEALDMIPVREIDGTFPDWQRIVPPNVSGEMDRTHTFNPRYLTDFQDVKDRLAHTNSNPIAIGYSGTGPALIEIRPEDCFGVIMPCRAAPPSQPPEWFSQPQNAHETA